MHLRLARYERRRVDGLWMSDDAVSTAIDDLLDADEVFLTNSSWGVLPVVRIESRDIAAGTVGDLTTTLRNAWLDELA